MNRLTLPVAVFGPLATGADVQLLGRPEGGELSRAGAGQLELLFYACWRRGGGFDRSFWSFLKLDDRYWGLAKTEPLGSGGIGNLLVVAMALVDLDTLEQIDWQTPRLWTGELAAHQSLCPPGTVLPPIALKPLALAPKAAEEPRIDRLAYPLDMRRKSQASAGQKLEAVLSPASPTLDSERELALVLSRLGRLAKGISYCTWSGIDAGNQRGTSLGFDLVAGSVKAAAPVRKSIEPAAEVPKSWFIERERETGIAIPGGIEISAESAATIAGIWMKSHGPALLRNPDSGVMPNLIRTEPEKLFALPWLLERSVAALLPAKPDAAAKLIDAFTARFLEMSSSGGALPDPAWSVANIAAENKLVLRLAPDTIRDLHTSLLGSVGDAGLVTDIEEEADLAFQQRTPVSAAAQRILSLLEDDEPRLKLRSALHGLLWQHHDESSQSATREWISEGGTPAKAMRRLHLVKKYILSSVESLFIQDNWAVWRADWEAREKALLVRTEATPEEAALIYLDIWLMLDKLTGKKG